MQSLDSIWDDPVDTSNIPQQLKTAGEQPLFLGDSDNEGNAPRASTSKPKTNGGDVDIDAMFADLDDDGLFNFMPLAPALDTEALMREAEQRHKTNARPYDALPSSSPPREGAAPSTNKKDGTMGIKQRRRPIRLDEGRLLDKPGFPNLIKLTKDFKPKGKGHEVTDLNRLLQIYQFWTHELYPRARFKDTVERVEKLCHSKRMHVALSVWRDQAHEKTAAMDVIDLTDDERVMDATSHTRTRQSSPIQTGNRIDIPSRAPSHPPTSETEPDDDFDIDAIFQTAEQGGNAPMNKDTINAESKGGDVQSRSQGEPVQIADVDDEDMWDVVRELEDDANNAPSNQNTATTASDFDDDWDNMYI